MAIRTYAGKYDMRVTIWRNDPDRAANVDGQLPDDPELRYNRWASIKPVRGTQRFIAQQSKEDVTHLIRLRYDNLTKTITAQNWLTLADDTTVRFDIKRAFDVDYARREIELECNQRR